MSDILSDIIAYKREEVRSLDRVSLERAARPALDTPVPSMRQALLGSQSGIIAEFKRRSPSKGWIKQDGDAAVIPLAYQQHGAAALSILTDQHFFAGSDEYIATARRAGVTIPIIYKNFVIDERQLLAARACGASAVLLIAACLAKPRLAELLREAHNLGLEVLLEMHSEAETEYAELGPDMCGVNNRNLGSFVTDVQNSFRLAALLPADACRVSESGISSPDTVRSLRLAGYRGFLIGESFMRHDEPAQALNDFITCL